MCVLKTISRHGPVARTQLPALTGLSAGTISSVTADLVRRELIFETRDGSSSRGRPRVHLSVKASGAIVAGATIDGVGRLTVSFVDLAGQLLHSERAHIRPSCSLSTMAAEIAAALNSAIASSPFDSSDITRVGIALPGIVNSRDGTLLFMTTFAQHPTPFAQIVADAVGIPITIENDMVVMARAEHWFGRTQALDTFTLIHFGFNLGSARYVDGRTWSGANGITTEIAHTKISWGHDARSCYCGGRGCATAYSSIYGVLKAAGELENVDFPPANTLTQRFTSFLDNAERGDAVSLALLREAGARLGQTVGNHINAADPGEVLILLPDSRLEGMLADAFDVALVASVLPGMRSTAHISFELANDDWRWKGTAALALEQAYVDESGREN